MNTGVFATSLPLRLYSHAISSNVVSMCIFAPYSAIFARSLPTLSDIDSPAYFSSKMYTLSFGSAGRSVQISSIKFFVPLRSAPFLASAAFRSMPHLASITLPSQPTTSPSPICSSKYFSGSGTPFIPCLNKTIPLPSSCASA